MTEVPTTPAPTTSAPPTTTAAEPETTIPSGILAAMPFQNRLDAPLGIFQVKLYNGTGDDLDIVGVQLVWAGLTTPVSHRENRLVAGDRLDYPVPLASANCVGDGTAASMPDPQQGVVKVSLRDGEVIDVPVFDAKHFAERLYLDDCERQHIESEVGIEWADLHEVDLDGRPVTEGVLRITRRAATTTLTVRGIRNTINFRFEVIDGHTGDVGVLAPDQSTLDVPVRFLEGRCDAHARSESSQPFAFVAELDLGDGVQRFLVVSPSLDDQVPMRERIDRACDLLGTSGFAGEGDASTTSTVP